MKLILVLFVLIFGISFFVLNLQSGLLEGWPALDEPDTGFLEELKAADANALLEQIEKEVLAPPPLRQERTRGPVQAAQSDLTPAGVLQWTNVQRLNNALSPLSRSLQLDSIAQAKLQDMFEEQYFAHVSPSGKGAGDLAKEAGYEFIAIGENLALGNYEGDQALVQAWMDSPGHRANILNARYEELGVAVGQGFFEGSLTWLAVQTFAQPLSSCPLPDVALKEQIEASEIQIEELQNTLALLKAELEGRPKRRSAYEEKLDEYNALVQEYNALIKEVKILISQYNAQVQAFNGCAVIEP